MHELPKLEDGSVDWHIIADDVWDLWNRRYSEKEAMELLKAIDANARAEERERCAKAAGDWFEGADEGFANTVGDAIRNLGDE